VGGRGADGSAPPRGGWRWGWRLGPLLAVALVAGCASPRIVPVPAAGVQVDAARGTASVAAERVELSVRPSAWRGSPWELADYFTPFLVTLTNGAAVPVRYDYVDFRLFDDSRFQYTALPPAEVERILRWRTSGDERLAALASPAPILNRRRLVSDPYWDRWGGPYGWPWGPWWPWYYPGGPITGDVYALALPMGTLQPDARLEGFVYFPRLRAAARGLTLEFHHHLGELPRVLRLPFEVEPDTGSATGS
jgi:hypothetical protein